MDTLKIFHVVVLSLFTEICSSNKACCRQLKTQVMQTVQINSYLEILSYHHVTFYKYLQGPSGLNCRPTPLPSFPLGSNYVVQRLLLLLLCFRPRYSLKSKISLLLQHIERLFSCSEYRLGVVHSCTLDRPNTYRRLFACLACLLAGYPTCRRGRSLR
jgi:hypothetical protein